MYVPIYTIELFEIKSSLENRKRNLKSETCVNKRHLVIFLKANRF